jgi:hypothetical protein
MKVVLLLVYIVLGWLALRSAKRSHRLGFSILAAATFLFIVGVARAHHPLGVLAKQACAEGLSEQSMLAPSWSKSNIRG